MPILPTMAVDVMAPGVIIYSTVPTGNDYSFLAGTSMAALIFSYFPNLSAVEVKSIIEQTVNNSYSKEKYIRPGDDTKLKMLFSVPCKTGGVMNALNAVVLAAQKSESKAVSNKK